MTAATETVRTADLIARLRRHYIKPGQDFAGGIFIPECGFNGGATLSRVDALYVGFTSSSGRRLVGHELKVSRADWRHELDQPGKADAWADQCHAWYVVAPSTAIVPAEELPDGWGLMVINPRTTTRLDVVVKARVHADRTPSWDVARSIMARTDTLNVTANAEYRRKADQAAHEKAERARVAREQQPRGQGLTAEQARRLELLARLENAAGWQIAGYDDGDDRVSPERLAAAIELCRAANLDDLPAFTRKQVDGHLAAVRDGLAELDRALDTWRRISGGRR